MTTRNNRTNIPQVGGSKKKPFIARTKDNAASGGVAVKTKVSVAPANRSHHPLVVAALEDGFSSRYAPVHGQREGYPVSGVYTVKNQRDAYITSLVKHWKSQGDTDTPDAKFWVGINRNPQIRGKTKGHFTAISASVSGHGSTGKGDDKKYVEVAPLCGYAAEFLSVSELVRAIAKDNGFSWVPGLVHPHDTRVKNAFCGAFVIGGDVDNDSESESATLTLDDALADPFIAENAAVIVESASSTAKQNKFRIVFVLESPILSKDEYAKVIAYLFHKIPALDTKCSDESRFFFGSLKEPVLVNPSARLTKSIVNDATAWVEQSPEMLEKLATGGAKANRIDADDLIEENRTEIANVIGFFRTAQTLECELSSLKIDPFDCISKQTQGIIKGAFERRAAKQEDVDAEPQRDLIVGRPYLFETKHGQIEKGSRHFSTWHVGTDLRQACQLLKIIRDEAIAPTNGAAPVDPKYVFDTSGLEERLNELFQELISNMSDEDLDEQKAADEFFRSTADFNNPGVVISAIKERVYENVRVTFKSAIAAKKKAEKKAETETKTRLETDESIAEANAAVNAAFEDLDDADNWLMETIAVGATSTPTASTFLVKTYTESTIATTSRCLADNVSEKLAYINARTQRQFADDKNVQLLPISVRDDAKTAYGTILGYTRSLGISMQIAICSLMNTQTVSGYKLLRSNGVEASGPVFPESRQQVVEAPTGAGKTPVASSVIGASLFGDALGERATELFNSKISGAIYRWSMTDQKLSAANQFVEIFGASGGMSKVSSADKKVLNAITERFGFEDEIKANEFINQCVESAQKVASATGKSVTPEQYARETSEVFGEIAKLLKKIEAGGSKANAPLQIDLFHHSSTPSSEKNFMSLVSGQTFLDKCVNAIASLPCANELYRDVFIEFVKLFDGATIGDVWHDDIASYVREQAQRHHGITCTLNEYGKWLAQVANPSTSVSFLDGDLNLKEGEEHNYSSGDQQYLKARGTVVNKIGLIQTKRLADKAADNPTSIVESGFLPRHTLCHQRVDFDLPDDAFVGAKELAEQSAYANNAQNRYIASILGASVVGYAMSRLRWFPTEATFYVEGQQAVGSVTKIRWQRAKKEVEKIAPLAATWYSKADQDLLSSASMTYKTHVVYEIWEMFCRANGISQGARIGYLRELKTGAVGDVTKWQLMVNVVEFLKSHQSALQKRYPDYLDTNGELEIARIPTEYVDIAIADVETGLLRAERFVLTGVDDTAEAEKARKLAKSRREESTKIGNDDEVIRQTLTGYVKKVIAKIDVRSQVVKKAAFRCMNDKAQRGSAVSHRIYNAMGFSTVYDPATGMYDPVTKSECAEAVIERLVEAGVILATAKSSQWTINPDFSLNLTEAMVTAIESEDGYASAMSKKEDADELASLCDDLCD